ncbi:MAG TPA: TetR/AcrR family transcriptional regulator [Parasegetibacter sp.]|jgi:AcrR family transcriptional regulator
MDIRERIRLKAEELFKRFGIRSVTMDEIAAQLSISKKTIYQYFTDKDSLVDAVINEELNRSQSDCCSSLKISRNAIEEVFLIMENIERQFLAMSYLVIYDLERFHFKTYKKVQEHKDKFLYEMITKNQERGISEGLYRPDINQELMARFRLASLMLMFNQDVFPASKYNLIDLQRELLEHYLFGLATVRGHKLIVKYKEERIKKSAQNDTKHKVLQ